jgi:hypothetical protein
MLQELTFKTVLKLTLYFYIAQVTLYGAALLVIHLAAFAAAALGYGG